MKKTIIIVPFLFLVPVFGFSKKLCDLPEVTKYAYVAVDKDKIYITDRYVATFHIYDRKDFSHLNQFGKRGEGPGEFKSFFRPPILQVFQNKLLINSSGKLSFFSKDGYLLEESKIPPYTYIAAQIKDQNYIGWKFLPPSRARRGRWGVVILDSKFEVNRNILTYQPKGVELFINRIKPDMKLLTHCNEIVYSENKIFKAGTEKGFFFEVLDLNGKLLYEINLPYEKRKVTSKDKEILLEERKGNRTQKKWDEHRKRYNKIVFPDYFPAFNNFQTFDCLIYVITHLKKEDNRQETFVLDIKGNLLKKIFLPWKFSSYVYDNKFYYLVENEKTETWELHVEEIE